MTKVLKHSNKSKTPFEVTSNNKHSKQNEVAEARSTTRVCIKNLPSSPFAESDLKTFILDQLERGTTITDCRILKDKSGKSRRIGFVGFLKPSQAQHCVDRLNKSYCKSSRLMVEYAQLPTLKSNNENEKEESKEVGTNAPEKLEKKNEALDKVEKKKQEFLAVMGVGDRHSETTTARKFWANDDDNPQMANEDNTHDKVERAVESDSESSSQDSDDDDSQCSTESADDADALQNTDMDFLRSKKTQVSDFDADDALVDEPAATKAESDDESDSSEESSSESMLQSKLSPRNAEKAMEPNQESTGNNKDDDEQKQSKTMAINRLFLRNLPFSATEEDLRDRFKEFGSIVECHIPADDQKRSKGFGFITFSDATSAKGALTAVDGTDFQGRILHVLPAQEAKTHTNDHTGAATTYKDEMDRKRKENALTEKAGWSASFVRGDAVVDNLASRLGLKKGDIMAVKDGLSAGDAAVRLALGETAVIEENRKYFANHGYDMDVLVSAASSGTGDKADSIPRSKTALLVKNLPHDTAKDELLKMFGSKGAVPKLILLPPSRTIAVIEYSHGNDAKAAFRKLAYRRFKSVPLYLEWAPLAAKKEDVDGEEKAETNDEVLVDSSEATEALVSSATHSLYVKNLNFKTTESQLQEFFSQHFKDVRSVRIPTKVAPIKRARGATTVDAKPEVMSMGFGFVEFATQESAVKALKSLNGKIIDGHAIELKPSERGSQQQEPRPAKTDNAKNPSKLMVRNVPFQASRKELLQLFGSFGQLKKVRLPKKFDGTNRGFAFVEYLTGHEAAAAMKSLSKTHLYGRHLVIEWAATDDEVGALDTLRGKSERDVSALTTAPRNKKIKFN